ncbi:uncharacterized protein LOC131803028 isoform X2 [Musca domestica]|uniref:Phosphatidylinositol-glycan biosynthesis class W protein n=1 Tax=Musca domestica TaxID=7370 RepID=A0ABM3V2H6_MUSDO|nr:uncharacterized protein LOC131803028 isoform X2 [Musca domestica]
MNVAFVAHIKNLIIQMSKFEIYSQNTLERLWPIQCTILVALIAIALARVARQRCCWCCSRSWCSVYILEFLVISIPTVLSVNLLHKYVAHILLGAILALALTIWRTKCLQKASRREFEFGQRPALFTLLRTNVYLLTVLCILAVDFTSFPLVFRKHRTYGAGLMDVGIGLFVFAMALVSSRPKRFTDLRKMLITVTCMLILGMGRTIVIAMIGYGQDEHEYGKHLNAFFTLGFTKLFGTLFGFLARSHKHLLPLGLVILIIHEVTLQCGIASFVLDPFDRTDLLTANREGICSLPGFIALYLLSQYIGQWIKSKDVLSFEEIKQKLIHLSCCGAVLWLVVISSVMVIGIARVTCNFGYVTWMLAIAVTMCALYLFVFDIVLDTLLPVNKEDHILELTNPSEKGLLGNAASAATISKIPTLVEAINYNGLVYFLLGNVLTGAVNIFLNTDERSNTESVVILMGYMFLTSLVVSLMYRFKIRIA